MRIDKVELKNIGVIRSGVFDMSSNLVALVGPNGSGKSTLLNSIYAALTNDFSRFGSSKAAAVNNAADGEHAYIRLEGQHQGRKFTLLRSLVPGKNEFVWTGDSVKFTRADDVDAEVRNVLGVSKTILDKYIFVAQGDMFDFLDQTPSVRAKLFQHMCGVEEAAKVHQACSAFLSRTRAHDVVDTTSQIDADITHLNLALAADAAAVTNAMHSMMSPAARAELVRLLDETTAYEKQAEAYRNTAHQVTIAQGNVQAAAARLVELDATIAPLREYIDANAEAYAQAKAAITAAQQASVAVNRMQELLLTRSRLQERISQLVEPDSAQLLSPHDSAQAFGLIGQAQRAIQQYDSVRKQHTKQCPTCLQSIQDSHIQLLRQEAEKATSLISQLEPRLKLSASTQQAITQYAAEKAQLTQSFEHADQQLATLTSVSTAAAGVDLRTHEFVADYTRKLHAEQAAQRERAGVANALAGYESSLAVWSAEAARAQTALASLRPLSPESAAQSRALVTQADEARLSYRVHRMAHSDRAVACGKLWRQKEHIQAEIARAAKRTQVLEVASRVLDAFHWDALPKRVTQSNLELLVADINSNLVDFQAPFTVEVTDDLSFHVHFPDRRPLDAKQLSGGQKVMLALAFRLSLDRIFGGGIGMLFLDEPSAGLDVVNQTIFYETLRNIVARTSEPRQLVVVTHTTGLGKFFDSVVELGTEV